MDQRQFTTPDKSETSEIFAPNKWQVMGSAYYVPRPRRHRKLSVKAGIAILIVTMGITYAVMYVVARVLG